MKITISKLSTWMIVLSVAGYPLVSFIPALLRQESFIYSLVLRSIILLSSLVVIAFNWRSFFLRKMKIIIAVSFTAFLTFWIIYSLRLFYDLTVMPIPLILGNSPFYYYSFAFGSSFFPAFATHLSANKLKLDKLYKYQFIFIFLFALITILSLAFHSEITFFKSGRIYPNVSVNPITTGHCGVSLMFLGLFYAFSKSGLTKTILAYVGVLLGVFLLALSASRSPIAVGVICSVLMIFLVLSRGHITTLKVKHIIVISISILMASFIFSASKVNQDNLVIIERFLETGGDKEVRNTTWKMAFKQFVNNPIFGDQFIERTSGEYPHNIFLEVLMATGITGAIPFFIFLFLAYYKGVHLVLKKKKYVIAFVMLMQFFLGSLTSGSLFGAGSLWIMLSLFASIDQNKIHDTK